MPDRTGLAAADGHVDDELVRLAQSGDVAALGHVLARHQAAMMAVALAVLGHPAEAEDAVQDAMLVALSRIRQLREPGSVGPWLKMIVRNHCRMRLRARPAKPVGELTAESLRDGLGDPAELLERHAVRDWVWSALEQLSPPLRLVTILRYFTGANTYEQIAAVCGVPVGTVRSRLSKARATLSQGLRSAASAAQPDVAARTAARWREAERALAAGPEGGFGQVLRETWHPGVEVTWADGSRTRGITPVAQVMGSSVDAGVQHRLTAVVASRDIVVWDIEAFNPAVPPGRCTPRSRWSWLLFLEDGRVRRLRQFPAPNMHS